MNNKFRKKIRLMEKLKEFFFLNLGEIIINLLNDKKKKKTRYDKSNFMSDIKILSDHNTESNEIN